MALKADLGGPAAVCTPYTSPVSGMGIDSTIAVAPEASITIGMAALARLQVPARLAGVVRRPQVLLAARAERTV